MKQLTLEREEKEEKQNNTDAIIPWPTSLVGARSQPAAAGHPQCLKITFNGQACQDQLN
jgi:hypothetical protein